MKIRAMVIGVAAAVMTAVMSFTAFAGSEIYFDNDGYAEVYDDGTAYYYNYRKKSVEYYDEDGNYMNIDRRGNITYYDADGDDFYYFNNNSSRSSSSSGHSGSGVVQRNATRKSSTTSSAANPSVSNPQSSYGWQLVNGMWKYRRSNGTFASNCWEQVNGKWYSFDQNGNMRVNQWIRHTTNEHVWYYVGSDGAMVTNTNVGGYSINANGECYF